MHVDPKRDVVVPEEDRLIRRLLERWLGKAGYRIAARTAASGARPALVIADRRYPMPAEPPIPALQEYAARILVLSAPCRGGLAVSAKTRRRLGVKKVLPKPLTRKELLAAVRESVEA